MHYTIEELLKSNLQMQKYYSNAIELWEEIDSLASRDSQSLSQVIRAKQSEFEQRCGGRNLGQEIMVVSGIGRHYSTARGLEDVKARAVYKAIKDSMCSLEVKVAADKIAESYSINSV